jgi:uncharacterized protein YndB with AHSA1/START domain
MYRMVQRIEHTATTSADPTAVYALLIDGASWPSWSPIESVELEGDGTDGHVGTVRVLRSGKVTGRDTIAELVPDRRFAYTHASSLPVKNYRGEIDLTPIDGGTSIRWVSTFEPKFPGTGRLVKRGLGKFIGEMTNGLARGADRRVAAAA